MNYIDGNNYIAYKIKTKTPSAIGKIGVVELKLLYNYTMGVKQYSPDVIHEAQYIAGIYPYTPDEYNKFVKIYTKALKNFDALAVWNTILKQFELDIVNHIQAQKIKLQDIEPYFHKTPWSEELKNKNVLLISQCAISAAQQYSIREKIWSDNILPHFNLNILKYPNAKTVDNRTPYNSTLEIIEIVKKEMSKTNFDVAIIGVGGASIPLTSYAKELGKIGIHMGGATQILFGIRGKRWDNIPEFHKFFNEHWIRPSPEETPQQVELVEEGCYW